MASAEPLAVLTDLNAEHECLTALSNTAQELVKFRLYEDTEGVWVCCDYCNKWRYVEEQKDPAAFLKRSFHCKDVKKKCNVGTEKGHDQVFYETKFCAGSLVWAKRPNGRKEKNWLWWPALVEDSPDSVSQYFLLDAFGHQPIAYHVTFLDAYRTSGWVGSNLIKPFDPQAKALKKVFESRAGKKRRFLKEALERAKNAATFDVKDRLENFSYIAHMARLKGLIKTNKQPADKILNGLQRAPELPTEDPPGNETNTSTVKRGRGRPRKRPLETSESEVIRKKAVPPEAPVEITAAREATPSSENESLEEMQVQVSTKIDEKMDVDSGYAVDEESLIEEPVAIGKERESAEGRKDESDSLNMSEISSSGEADESQATVPATDKAKERELLRSPREKETAPKKVESSKKRSRKNVVEESQISSSEPVEAPETRPSKRKKSPPKTSPGKSQPDRETSVPRTTVSDSIADVGESEAANSIQDNGTESLDDVTLSLVLLPSIPEEEEIGEAGYDSEPNTLESTSNLKVVRKRRSKSQDALGDENKPLKPVFFTQVPRKDKPTKTLGLSRRQDTASVRPSHSFSASQPLPSRPRGKFAPPTRAKPRDQDYTFDDFHRDLDEGVI